VLCEKKKTGIDDNNNLVKADATLDNAYALVADAKNDKDKANARLAEAEASLERLEAADAPANQIATARAVVTAVQSSYGKAIDAFKSAIDVVKSAIDAGRLIGTVPVVKPFSFKPDVRERLRRPLDKWEAGETFDVTGFGEVVGVGSFQDTIYLRAAGLEALRVWESGSPYLIAYGSPGIGKSTLLQLAMLRALANGERVLLHFNGRNFLIEMEDDDHLSYATVGDARDVRGAKNLIVCCDSCERFDDIFDDAMMYKKVFVVYSPSLFFKALKIIGMTRRYLENPTEEELIAVAAFAGFRLRKDGERATATPTGIDADEARERIDRYGPSLRFVCDPVWAEDEIDKGIISMVSAGIEGLTNLAEPTRKAHRLTMLLPNREGGSLLVFASDYIRDKAFAAMAARSEINLLHFISRIDVLGSLRGQGFESRMIYTLGKRCTVTFNTASARLVETKGSAATDADDADAATDAAAGSMATFAMVDGADMALQISHPALTLRLAKEKFSLPDGERALRRGVLYLPPTKTKAWDALIVGENDSAYVIQMTVALEHSVDRAGLDAAATFLADRGVRGKIHLVFLVPSAAFNEFKLPQKVVIADKKTEAVDAGQWDQLVWVVNAVNGVAFWRGLEREPHRQPVEYKRLAPAQAT
jgi:hypothetical protein